MAGPDDLAFRDAVQGLEAGDFSRLEPLFTGDRARRPRILEWLEAGRFAAEPRALAEALTCACFLGADDVARTLLSGGVDPTAGNATGLDAIHWAVNRGQWKTTALLLQRGVPLEGLNRFGSTVLGIAVWSAVHEPRPDHRRIIEALLAAGAQPETVATPTGLPEVDALLGAASAGGPRPDRRR